jgi:serine/threonine protein kinase
MLLTQIFPKVEDLLLDLIDRVLVYDPLQRARVAEVLAHEYFDELRDRFTYMHIKGQYHLNDFFNFSEPELKGSAHLRPKLIPKWYYDHYS